jgi:L-phenylalanine/L-methionine N-acetyltransferase
VDPVIRAVAERDHEAIHQILTSPHVLAGTMRLPYAGLHQTKERLSPRLGTYQVVAVTQVDDERVIGFGELITEPEHPRHSHVGDLNMVATRADSVGQGVGRKLAESLIDLAENWLNIRRLSLIVFSDNQPAIRLYESLGFEVEGTMRRFGYGNGAWMDAIMMGRLRTD